VTYSILAMAFYLLLGGFYAGLAGDRMPARGPIVPNEGMHRSLQNALRTGIAGAVIGLSASVAGPLALGGLQLGLHAASTYAPIEFVSCGLLAGLLYGGAACCQHAMVRALLALEGSLPPRAVRLLAEAVDRGLLRRSGGGYEFVHDLFRDHLASLAKPNRLSRSA
jgi:hypothetical protein